MEGAVARAEELCRKNKNHFMPQQFNNPANPEVHRRTTARELIAQLGERGCDAFVAGVGTGGTITGVGEVFRDKYPGRADHRRRAGDVARCCRAGPSGRTRSRASAPASCRRSSNRHVIDEVRKVSDRDAYETKVRWPRKRACSSASRRARTRSSPARWPSSSARASASSPSCATPASATSRSTSTSHERGERDACWSSARAGSAARRSRWRWRRAWRTRRHRRRRRRRAVEPESADPASHRGRGTPQGTERARRVLRRFPTVNVETLRARVERRQRRRGGARLGRGRRRHRLVRRQVPDQRRLRARAACRWCTAASCASPGSSCRSCPARPAIAACSRRRRRRASAPSCQEAGILGAFAGVIGALMADEALAILDGKPRLAGTLLVVDGLDDRRRRVARAAAPRLRRRPIDSTRGRLMSFVQALQCKSARSEYPERGAARLRGLLRSARGRLRLRRHRARRCRARRSPSARATCGAIASCCRIDGEPTVGLNAGFTPLVRAQRLGEALGHRDLWVKNDAVSHPTLSFKDRVVAVALSKAKELGFDTVACASTGNLANSTAANAAAGGPALLRAHPARPRSGQGARHAGLRAAPRARRRHLRRRQPLVLGDRRPPPVGLRQRQHPPLLRRGLEDLRLRNPGAARLAHAGARGRADGVGLAARPRSASRSRSSPSSGSSRRAARRRLYGAQAAGCGPIAEAVLAGRDAIKPVKKPNTIAKSLAIGNPADGPYAAQAIRASGGYAAARQRRGDHRRHQAPGVDRGHLHRDRRRRHRRHGPAPHRRGAHPAPTSRRFCASPATGLKTQEPLVGALPLPPAIAPRIDEFEKVL